jgi:NitT/TauT family transport system permease protein
MLLCFFPVVISSMAGLTATPAELVELARSMPGRRHHTYLKIRIPWALPQVFVGLKLAITQAMIGAVIAQMWTPNAGLGAVIVRSGQSADAALKFAAILLLALISVLLFYTVVGLERLLLPWAKAVTA